MKQSEMGEAFQNQRSNLQATFFLLEGNTCIVTCVWFPDSAQSLCKKKVLMFIFSTPENQNWKSTNI